MFMFLLFLLCLFVVFFLVFVVVFFVWGEDGLKLMMNVIFGKGGKMMMVISYYDDKKVWSSDLQLDMFIDYVFGMWIVFEYKKKKYWMMIVEEMNVYYEKLNQDMDGNFVFLCMVGDVGEVCLECIGKIWEIVGYVCEEWIIIVGEKYWIEVWVVIEILMLLIFCDVWCVSMVMMGLMVGLFEVFFKVMVELFGLLFVMMIVVKVMGMKVDVMSEVMSVECGLVLVDVFEIFVKYKQKKLFFVQQVGCFFGQVFRG